MSLEAWAVDKLSVFMGFDPETLQTQILPYLMTSDTPEAFAAQLMDMVGASDEALAFIHEFTERRFHPKKELSTPAPPKPIVAQPTSSPSTSSATNIESEGAFPSLPSNQQPYDTMWPANIGMHQKKEDEYFAGLRKSKRSKNKSQNNTELRAAAFPAENKQTPKKEKKPKASKEMTLEAALKELDIKTEKPGKKRKPCECQATKHPLLTVAPNCLSCGKIICTAEGVGPCTFCGEPVLTKDQQSALIAEAKRKRNELKQAQNQTKKVLSTPQSGGMVAYAAKLGGGSGNTFSSPYQSSDDDESNRLRADRHRQSQESRLSDQSNTWLTPQERVLLTKKQQPDPRRTDKQGESSRHRVMTLDFRTRQVKVRDASLPSSDEDDEEEEANTKLVPKNSAVDKRSAGTYSYNPLLKDIIVPKYVNKSTKKAK